MDAALHPVSRTVDFTQCCLAGVQPVIDPLYFMPPDMAPQCMQWVVGMVEMEMRHRSSRQQDLSAPGSLQSFVRSFCRSVTYLSPASHHTSILITNRMQCRLSVCKGSLWTWEDWEARSCCSQLQFAMLTPAWHTSPRSSLTLPVDHHAIAMYLSKSSLAVSYGHNCLASAMPCYAQFRHRLIHSNEYVTSCCYLWTGLEAL